MQISRTQNKSRNLGKKQAKIYEMTLLTKVIVECTNYLNNSSSRFRISKIISSKKTDSEVRYICDGEQNTCIL